MKLSTICCVLTGLLVAVPLSNRSPLRVLSVNESSSVRGAQIGGFYPFTKCGTTNECKENTCSVDDCSGWATTPTDNAPNQGCNDLDWLSFCMEENVFNILQMPQPCASKGGACFPTTEEVDGILVVTACTEVIGNGFVFVPVAPNSCSSISLVDLLLPL